MNILFLLSSLEPAGSETYCLSLARAWENKHTVHWISDQLHFGQRYTAWPISRKIFPHGIRNILRVTRFIRENRIDLVHSHSRRSHWVASHASRFTGIPHVTTIHQPPPVHFFSKLEPCMGDVAIAVSETARDHVIKYFRVKPERVHLIRNGISIPAPLPPHTPTPIPPHSPTVLLLGRLSGHRWEAYQFLLQVLERTAAQLPAAKYLISGRIPEDRRAFIDSQIADVNRIIAPSSLELAGWTSDLPELIRSVDIVIGAGRSALESLALEKPVIVLGERAVLGLCGPDNWNDCLRTNLGDHHPTRDFFPARLELALRDALNPSLDRAALGRWGRDQVIRDYNLDHVASRVERIYENLISAL